MNAVHSVVSFKNSLIEFSDAIPASSASVRGDPFSHLLNLQKAELNLQKATTAALDSESTSWKELVRLQMVTSRHHLQVEVISRMGEALHSGIRRLQQGSA